MGPSGARRSRQAPEWRRPLGAARTATRRGDPSIVIMKTRNAVVLRGEAQLGISPWGVGDYHLARSGSRHGIVRPARGACSTCGHAHRPWYGGRQGRDQPLLPRSRSGALTVHRDEGEWD